MSYQSLYLEPRLILTAKEKEFLRTTSAQYPYARFVSFARSFEERAIAYAYVSAKIEGNRYSNRGAAMLLAYGFTEAGMQYKDAVMLVNLKNAFEAVTRRPVSLQTILTKDYVCALHARVMEGLLPKSASGTVRSCPMQIVGCNYLPPTGEEILDSELEKLLDVAAAMDDPFELSVYLHCNLVYLQYFADGNKRLARLIQTAVLASFGLTPLFLQERSIDDYRKAIVHYYETGDYSPYKALFLQDYEHSIRFLSGQTKAQIESEERALKAIRKRQKDRADI